MLLNTTSMNFMLPDKFKGCIYGGAIGDAWGSCYENITEQQPHTFYIGGFQAEKRDWQLTDDTILTLATCEFLLKGVHNPAHLATTFIDYFKRYQIIGIGSSTLKAFQDLSAGLSWTQSGRTGEFAAGNGGAMRVAPFAFVTTIGREHIRDYIRITHNNDEAYVGALAIYLTLQFLHQNTLQYQKELIEYLVDNLPDTNVRDRIMLLSQVSKQTTIAEYAQLGNNGYVANSVPFAIFSAMKIYELGFETVLAEIIATKGDTDTNASLAGQIMGSDLGFQKLPLNLLDKLKVLKHFEKLTELTNQ